MKAVAVLCFLAVLAYASARPEQYTDKYDHINLDEILSNRSILLPFIKCTLDQGRCSPEGRELKSHIKEALETYCEKCNQTQKNGTRRVISHLINNEGDYWNQLIAKYDPSRKYVHKYEQELRTVTVKA